MSYEINTRHFTLEDELKEKLSKRLDKLERFSPRSPVSVRLTVTQEGGRFTADLAYLLKNSPLYAKAERTEPDLAAEEAIENLERQLRRLKDRLATRGRDEEGGLGAAMAAPGLLSTEGTVLEESGFQLRDLSVEAAVEIFQRSPHPFFVFRHRDSSRVAVVYRRDDGGVAVMHEVEG